MSENIDPERFKMRAPCKSCGCEFGVVREVSRQDTVRCISCGTFAYNAPRTETGREARTVTTVHNGVRPKLRTRVLERDGYRCVLCRAVDVPLHVGHIVSVDGGLAMGLSDQEINDEENLIAQCEECNAGQGAQPIALRVAVCILKARITWRNKHEGKP